MKIKYVLFDLDGTLLPMNQEEFTKAYFGLLAKKLAPLGYEPNKLIESIWSGTKAMIKNAGERTNEVVFWNTFASIYGEDSKKDLLYFDEFNNIDFDKVQPSCGYNPKAQEVIALLKSKNITLALATNPIFPKTATTKRIAWAGLNKNDFSHITTYENSNFCKPNLKYYEHILNILGAKAEECLMIGNDIAEDMVTENLGIKTFLLTDCLINKTGEDISKYNHGTFDDLIEFINKNC